MRTSTCAKTRLICDILLKHGTDICFIRTNIYVKNRQKSIAKGNIVLHLNIYEKKIKIKRYL